MLSRRSLLAAPALLGAAAALPPWAVPPARAQDGPTGAASPPIYRFRVGKIEVTALADGTLPMEREVFPEAVKDPYTADRLLALSALPKGPVPTFVNTYLVNTGERLMLVDAGTGPSLDFGPNLGRLPAHLSAAGIDPKSIDAVVLTHMHPDHAGGLAPGGVAAFPNAELVVMAAEHAFWTDETIAAQAPDAAKPFFRMAQAAVKPYEARTRKLAGGEAAPGVTLEAAPGHTPGHALVRVQSGSDQLVIWGDVVHSAAFQFERPDWSLAFDTDQDQAAKTRRRVFDMAAADRLLVAGMHLPFPGLGRVTRRDQAYAYVPEPWQA
jgi:glyoxylase-like metal-dependent hydrolase (beta-lactamase superfamily II)